MKRSLLLLFLLCLGFSKSMAQSRSNVDFTRVYSVIADTTSPFYYPQLMERYMANDTMLTFFEYHHLYYGYTKQPDYSPYKRGTSEIDALQLMGEGKLEEAKQLLLQEYKTSPFSLNLLFRLGSLADMQQNTTEARMWLMKFDGLLRTILDSGDGRSEETAWVVISAKDEYPILGVLGLEPIGQGVLKRKYDVQTLKTPNDMETGKLFFNIEVPFQHMTKVVTEELAEADKPGKLKKGKRNKAISINK